MARGASGTYRISKTNDQMVRAFLPNPLPPNPPIDLGGKRTELLERALVSCGRFDGITATLPDPALFLYSFVRKEAVLSSQIEGAQSSLSDLLLFEAQPAAAAPGDVREVSCYVAAIEFAVARMKEDFPLSLRLIRDTHAELLRSGKGAEKLPGQFRTSQNWIGGTRPGNAHFVPPPPGEVMNCLGDLEKFMNAEEDGYSSLIRAAIVHAQFETIHPFLDGNGRTGRMLISLMLFRAQIIRQPHLYISLYFKQHREEYYRRLDRVRSHGEWEEWVEFFLEGVASSASFAADSANRLLHLFGEDSKRIDRANKSYQSVKKVLIALQSVPFGTVGDIASRAKLLIPSADRAIKVLESMGILSEITNRKRGRVYAYDAYLSILSEDTEPL